MQKLRSSSKSWINFLMVRGAIMIIITVIGTVVARVAAGFMIISIAIVAVVTIATAMADMAKSSPWSST